MSEITIGEYLLQRLKEIGIQHIFGVPGDYNLEFLDQIEDYPGLEWYGNCNELNAAYAADGYARLKGIAALVTTFGVGELSAMNGIAGSYAELVPVVHIVGMPATRIKDSKALVHHSLGNGDFNVFMQMFQKVTAAHTCLSEHNAAGEIDRVLQEAWITKRPIYIGLPSDVAFKKVAAPLKKLNLDFPASHQDAVKEAAARAAEMIRQAKSPVALIDACSARFHMKKAIESFLKKTGLPFASMNMAKAVIDENHPQFIGTYAGSITQEKLTRSWVEMSDCLVSFGALRSDFNTGGFSCKFNANASIEIHGYHAKIKQALYQKVLFCDFIPALEQALGNYHYAKKIDSPARTISLPQEEQKITQDRFWYEVEQILKEDSTIIAETGTSMCGALQMRLPARMNYISQSLWGSIGYSVGALLGACVAAPQRENILFVGDGSFQLTAQELSTMLRHNLTPIIFLLNNEGYTIERAIDGENRIYNDVQRWNYKELPRIFGSNVWSIRVETTAELKQALKELEKHSNQLRFIEVIMDKTDYPSMLKTLSQRLSQARA